MYTAIFSNIPRKKEELWRTVYLLFPVLLKTLVTWRFAAGARIAVKLEQNVAMGNFYLRVKKALFPKMEKIFWGIFEMHAD